MNLTPAESDALYRRILQALVDAGWLHRFVFTEGRGLHLVWTEEGGQIALALRTIVRTFGLQHEDQGGMALHKLAQGAALPAGVVFKGEPPALLLEFWREQVDRLGLGEDAEGLLGLVHIVERWSPGAGTPKISGN